jgi:hypothetical protein
MYNYSLIIYIYNIVIYKVGLMGGCAYVNVYYLILESKDIVKKEKELSVNLSTIMNDTGKTIA